MRFPGRAPKGKSSMAGKSATAVKKIRELSEEDVLAAPDKDYMNEAQLAFFRRKLIELRDQLLQNADDTGEHLRENEVTTDPSDRATLEEEYTLELRTRDRERKLLKKVEKSIRLIDDGSYGFCEETGEPIGVARLIARPTATLSLEAQERRERVL
jgi:DnaK suppressor protein